MEVAYAFLAQAAETTSSGGFFAFGGGMEAVSTEELPLTIPSIAVVAKFRCSESESKRVRSVELQVLSPSGESITPVLTAVYEPPKKTHADGRPYYHVLIANLHGMIINELGRLRFEIRHEGETLKTLELYVDKKQVESAV